MASDKISNKTSFNLKKNVLAYVAGKSASHRTQLGLYFLALHIPSASFCSQTLNGK